MKTVINQLYSTILLLLLVALPLFCQAQRDRKIDVIFFRNQTKLDVVIQEVLESSIKYKKRSDPDGPVFTVNKSEILSIEYGNGEVQKFEEPAETPIYFSPSKEHVAPYTYPSPPPRNAFEESIYKASPKELRTIYKFHKEKSKNGMAIGIGGIVAGMVVAGIGTGIVVNSTDDNGNYPTYQDELNARKGAWMMIGGFIGASTFGTLGFVKAGKNGSKASRTKRELGRRNEPLHVKFSPGYNPSSKSAYLSLNMRF